MIGAIPGVAGGRTDRIRGNFVVGIPTVITGLRTVLSVTNQLLGSMVPAGNYC
jgi:hypothetical protein